MPLNTEVAKRYRTTLPDDDRAHIFPGMGRRKIGQFTIEEIEALHKKNLALDVFIPLAAGTETAQP